MKKSRASNEAHRDDEEDRDTMRPEYDFAAAVRGQTVVRYAQGVNIAVVDPEVLDVFPDSVAVNKALRALAPLLREQRKQVGRSHRRGDSNGAGGSG
jgi:hypothetical protein